jgi:hypothetical protein
LSQTLICRNLAHIGTKQICHTHTHTQRERERERAREREREREREVSLSVPLPYISYDVMTLVRTNSPLPIGWEAIIYLLQVICVDSITRIKLLKSGYKSKMGKWYGREL